MGAVQRMWHVWDPWVSQGLQSAPLYVQAPCPVTGGGLRAAETPDFLTVGSAVPSPPH